MRNHRRLQFRQPASLANRHRHLPGEAAEVSAATVGGRSLLLRTTMVRSGGARVMAMRSSAVSGREASITSSTRSAAAAFSRARRTPSRSIGSSVSRTPAVSMRRSGKPPSTRLLLDSIARGAGNFGDDGPGLAEQGIEQGALADIGAAEDQDVDPLAQRPAGIEGPQQRVHLHQHRCRPRHERLAVEVAEIVIGKVDVGFEQQQQFDAALSVYRRSCRDNRPSSCPEPPAPPARSGRRSERPPPRPAPGRAAR